MPLLMFSNLTKLGMLRSRVIYPPTTQYTINSENLGNFTNVRCFKYTYNHEYLPPSLVKLNEQLYICPSFQKVHPQTTLEDINWVKPPKINQNEHVIQTFSFKSSSGTEEYLVTVKNNKFHCNCFGYKIVKDKNKGCKHIQTVKKEHNF